MNVRVIIECLRELAACNHVSNVDLRRGIVSTRNVCRLLNFLQTLRDKHFAAGLRVLDDVQNGSRVGPVHASVDGDLEFLPDEIQEAPRDSHAFDGAQAVSRSDEGDKSVADGVHRPEVGDGCVADR